MTRWHQLSEKDIKKLRRCYEANPNGCRSADNECGPFDRYGTRPCYESVGISFDEWNAFVSFEHDRRAAI